MKPDRGFWSVVCLILLAVLGPTGCILYLMNQAVNNQRDAARQKLAQAYRGQLKIVQQRLDAFWEKRAADLDLQSTGSAALRFSNAVRSNLADATIYLGDDGNPAYPAPPAAPDPDPAARRPDWETARTLENGGQLTEAAMAWAQIADHEADNNLAARALQAQIRCMAQRGRPGVLTFLGNFGAARFAGARDLQGRLIGADELLLTLRLIPAGDPRRTGIALSLHHLVADYEKVAMPAAQRLFLMEELRSLALGSGTADFPTYDAELLAARYLEAGRVRAGDAALRLSDIPDIWKLTTPSHRVIALYRVDSLMNVMPVGKILESVSQAGDSIALGVNTPGSTGQHDITLAGGSRLPGWQIVLDIKDSQQSDEFARRQRMAYLWVGLLMIATLAVAALISGRVFLRQLRLARLKTDLVATVSHELKTPLASIRLLVDTLLDDPGKSPADTREYLQLIARENARLSRLIENFLTFSRMERNRGAQFDLARTRPEEIVHAAVESIGDRFTVEVSNSPDLPAVHADSDALVTVLLNLLDNAFKYSAEPRRIALSAYSENGRCCFAVTDNGIGIPVRQRKKIFERFYQVNQNLTRQPGGVGLGLSIVEFIVRAHGGTMHVESQPGSGSRFVVSLPGFESSKGMPA